MSPEETEFRVICEMMDQRVVTHELIVTFKNPTYLVVEVIPKPHADVPKGFGNLGFFYNLEDGYGWEHALADLKTIQWK